MEKAQNPNSTQNQKSTVKRKVLVFYGNCITVGKINSLFVKHLDNTEKLGRIMEKFEVYDSRYDRIIPLRDYINIKFGKIRIASIDYKKKDPWLKIIGIQCNDNENECEINYIILKAYK